MNSVNTEIVVIDGYYAIRKTEYRFWVFRSVSFLKLTGSTLDWLLRDDKWFSACLSTDIDDIKRKLAYFGSNLGVPYNEDIMSLNEMISMIKLAKTNEGLRDLLLKAKEFYLLSK